MLGVLTACFCIALWYMVAFQLVSPVHQFDSISFGGSVCFCVVLILESFQLGRGGCMFLCISDLRVSVFVSFHVDMLSNFINAS